VLIIISQLLLVFSINWRYAHLVASAKTLFKRATLLADSKVYLVTRQRKFYASPNAVLLTVCNGRLTLIHHQSFAPILKSDFVLLGEIAKRHGWDLQQDRRLTTTAVSCERRQPHTMARTVLLVASLFSTTVAANDMAFYAASAVSDATIVRAFNLFSPSPKAVFNSGRTVDFSVADADQWLVYGAPDQAEKVFEYEINKYHKIAKILDKKWIKTSSDPETLASDLDELARYIASQPVAYQLVLSLSKKPLYLQYKRGQFRSLVKGNALTVRSVRVYFDPRSAAQLLRSSHCEAEIAHCVASPADALLHELLHAKVALLNTEQFIRSGAMNSLLYPRAHEAEVIGQERELYAAMSAKDKLPRPIRKNHSGALQNSACITCLDG
jgi:hypothetical protein